MRRAWEEQLPSGVSVRLSRDEDLVVRVEEAKEQLRAEATADAPVTATEEVGMSRQAVQEAIAARILPRLEELTRSPEARARFAAGLQ